MDKKEKKAMERRHMSDGEKAALLSVDAMNSFLPGMNSNLDAASLLGKLFSEIQTTA